MAYRVRKGKQRKWWVVKADKPSEWLDGPYDSKEEAEAAMKRLGG